MQSDEVARRAYWTQQLEAAYTFMFESILPYPVVECGEPFVSLREAAVQADVVVAFSSLKHVNNLDRLFYLREGQIPNCLGAAKKMNELGWVPRVEDGYRTPSSGTIPAAMPTTSFYERPASRPSMVPSTGTRSGMLSRRWLTRLRPSTAKRKSAQKSKQRCNAWRSRSFPCHRAQPWPIT